MSYDAWITTDWLAEDAAHEEEMIEKYGEDWKQYLEEMAESAIIDEY